MLELKLLLSDGPIDEVREDYPYFNDEPAVRLLGSALRPLY